MNKIAIIGACSYIAQNFINHIKDNELFLYDIQDEHPFKNFNYKKINIFERDEIDKINFNCDQLYIFAGLTGTSSGFDNYITFISVNEIGLLNILDGYVKHGSKSRIIFPSTRLVYKGITNTLLKENSEKEFKSLYAMNKYACEQYLKMYYDIFNVKYTVFRICIPYGTDVHGGSSYGTIEWMTKIAKSGKNVTLYGDGEQKRTFTHINDICSIMYSGAGNLKCEGGTFNIGGESLSLRQAAEKIAEKYNVDIEYSCWPELALKMESGDTIFDSALIDSILDYKYKITFMDWINSL